MGIKEEVTNFLKKTGYDPDKIPFIPISGFHGDNMIEVSTNMDWYKGQCPSTPLTPPSLQRGQWISHSAFLSRMFTRSVALEQSQSAASRLALSSQVRSSPSPHPA